MSKKMSRKYPLLYDKAWLTQKYVEDRLSSRAISELIGCCTSSVENGLKRFGIPARNGMGSHVRFPQLLDKAWLTRKYVEERLSPREISELIDCSSTSVVNGLKGFKVPMRNISESKIKHPLLDDKRWLEKKYLEEWLSIGKIARILRCGRNTVTDTLRGLDIPIHTRYDALISHKELRDKWWLEKKYVEERLSTCQIAELLGGTTPSVLAALKRHGIHVRSLADAYLCRKVRSGLSKTSIEITLEEIFNKYTKCIRYTGNSSLWIKTANNSLNPDFVVDGKKIAIEANGDYWHSPLLNRKVRESAEVKYRREALKKVGWKLIVFWETDINRDDAEQYVLHVLRREGIV